VIPFEGRLEIGRDAQIPADELEPRLLEQARERAAVIEQQPVEHPHSRPAGEQPANQHVADVAGSADDEDMAIARGRRHPS
jgi:hypothetical protein